MQCPYKELRTYKITYELDGVRKIIGKKGCTVVEVGEHFESTMKGFIKSIIEVR